MSIQVEPTSTITIDERVLQVSGLSDELKRTIALFDQWRQREVDLVDQIQALESDVIMVRSALQHTKNSLLVALQPPAEDAPAEPVVAEAEVLPIKTPRSRAKKA